MALDLSGSLNGLAVKSDTKSETQELREKSSP